MKKEKLITQFKGKTFSSNEQVIRWLEKAIAQTREETIKEVEEKVRKLRHELGQEESLDKTNREYFKEGHSECLNEVLDILNKLKK